MSGLADAPIGQGSLWTGRLEDTQVGTAWGFTVSRDLRPSVPLRAVGRVALMIGVCGLEVPA